MVEPYIGEILAVSFNFAPHGWAECNGQLLSISQNQALFSLLGTQFGGNGQTTFGLPDLRSRCAIGQGQGPGLSDRTIGETQGSETHRLLPSEMPTHTHAMMGSSSSATTNNPSNAVLSKPAVNARVQPLYGDTGDQTMADEMIATAGSGVPHENRQPHLAMLYVIALVGVFPPRS